MLNIFKAKQKKKKTYLDESGRFDDKCDSIL